MRKIFPALLIVTSFTSLAGPYVGVEYGVVTLTEEKNIRFDPDGVVLNPEPDMGLLKLQLGYQLDENWALELGYSQYSVKDKHASDMNLVQLDDGNLYLHQRQWDASIKARQLSLSPVYHIKLSNKWRMKLKGGVSYTQYQTNLKDSLQFSAVEKGSDINQVRYSASEDTRKYGGLLALGADYYLYPQWMIGGSAVYQKDSYMSSITFNLTSSYQF